MEEDNPVTPEQKLKIAKRYFGIGFCFLPLLWLVNYFLFRKETDANLRKYARWSVIGASVWIAALSIWIGVYYTTYTTWGYKGEDGDKFLVVIPDS